MDIFARHESIDYLLGRARSTEKDSANELAELLGDLPLALTQAAAYIHESQESIANYVTLFKKHKLDLLESGSASISYKQTVDTTWTITLEKIEKSLPAAIHFLRLFSFFGPDSIPLTAIREVMKGINPVEVASEGHEFPPELAEHIQKTFQQMKEIALDDLKFNRLKKVISQYSLAEVKNDLVFIHRMVQEVIRDRLGMKNKGTYVLFTFSTLTFLSNSRRKDISNAEHQNYLAHAIMATNHVDEAMPDNQDKDKISELKTQSKILELHHAFGEGSESGETPSAQTMFIGFLKVAAYASKDEHAFAVLDEYLTKFIGMIFETRTGPENKKLYVALKGQTYLTAAIGRNQDASQLQILQEAKELFDSLLNPEIASVPVFQKLLVLLESVLPPDNTLTSDISTLLDDLNNQGAGDKT